MTSAAVPRPAPSTSDWTVRAAPVDSPEAGELLREYVLDVADRYYLLRLGRRSLPEEITKDMAEHPSDDLTAPTGAFLVGWRGAAVAGCSGVRMHTPDTAELTRVYVRPEHRRTGGGALLVAAAERAAVALGARRIVLDTRLDLTEARALYLRLGYREIPLYKDDPYAEVCYGRDLP